MDIRQIQANHRLHKQKVALETPITFKEYRAKAIKNGFKRNATDMLMMIHADKITYQEDHIVCKKYFDKLAEELIVKCYENDHCADIIKETL